MAMSPVEQQLARRLADVRGAIARAARRAGRDPAAVTLVVVTKSAPAAIFPLLAAAGATDVGESRVQAAQERRASPGAHAPGAHEPGAAAVPPAPCASPEPGAARLRWHLVGHLQSNKAARALELFEVLHGVDSVALLQRLDAAAARARLRPELLLQVNVSGEASKHGLAPEDLPAALDVASGLEHVAVTGLMTMAPESDDPEAARGPFRALAALRDRCARPADGLPLRQLSMGMSDDFEVAVEEGATLVRVGRRIVEGLPLPAPVAVRTDEAGAVRSSEPRGVRTRETRPA
jgi:PLP dependent protein